LRRLESANLKLSLQTLLRHRFGARTERIEQWHLFGLDEVEFIERTKEVSAAPPAKIVITRDRVVV